MGLKAAGDILSRSIKAGLFTWTLGEIAVLEQFEAAKQEEKGCLWSCVLGIDYRW